MKKKVERDTYTVFFYSTLKTTNANNYLKTIINFIFEKNNGKINGNKIQLDFKLCNNNDIILL